MDIDELSIRNLAACAAATDYEAQNQAVIYLEQLKLSENGWKTCARAFTSGTYHQDDYVKFFCLQVCEHYIKSRYANAPESQVIDMKSFLLASLEMESNASTQSKGFIRNKLSQLISLAFLCDFPHRWTTFFPELLSTLNRGHLAIEMYLRVLLAIDGEVVDREVGHTSEEARRNTLIKDSMREQCVAQLADSWYQILTTYQDKKADLVNLCLKVAGQYVSWMDIGYFANDRMAPLLLTFLQQEQLREAACDCVHEIISKGMEPVAKRQLIESFVSLLDSAGILKSSDAEDSYFQCKLSKLVNGIGLGLITSWQKLAKQLNNTEMSATMSALESKVPLLLRYLGDEDDDVSESVLEFATEYIALVKTLPVKTELHHKYIKGLLLTLIKKLKYDESYKFDQEGEEEAEFQEYRKQARVLFNNIAGLDVQLILNTVQELISSTLPMWKTVGFQDLEVAITLLYSLGEAIPASHGQHFSGNPDKASALQNMMRILITSGVSRQKHQTVALQFFETVVRYDRFFACEPQHIIEVLGAFLDDRGLNHSSPKVRSRSSYLFLRFVKSTKTHLTPYVEQVLQQLSQHLDVHSPDNGFSRSLSENDQLFIYEAASTLIVSSNIDVERKQSLMKQLLTPMASKFSVMLGRLSQETNETKQQAYAECIQNAMSLASRASKGFSGQQTMKQCKCVSPFTELLSVFLGALDVTSQRALLQQGVRQYLHRMVVCLEGEIMPFLPEAMEKLLKQPDAKELYDFLPLINQVIMKFKAEIVPFLSQVFMPLVLTVYQVLSQPADHNDQCSVEEKKLLQRGYFLFLATVVSNCLDVLKTQEAHNVDQVLMSIVHSAVELNDAQSQKSCFSILRKLIESWGGQQGVSEFVQFIYKRIVPACFECPMKATFDLNDGQTTLALGECAGCMQEIKQQRGEEFLVFLRTDFFPSRGIVQEHAECYIASLQLEPKAFRSWLRKFFHQLRS